MQINPHALRAIREGRGLTGAAAAVLAGVPQPNWSKLESGDEQPGFERLTRIAAALRVPVEALVMGAQPVTEETWPYRRGRKRIQAGAA